MTSGGNDINDIMVMWVEATESVDMMLERLKLTEKYDKEAYQKAYEDAMQYVVAGGGNCICIGEPPVPVDTMCCETVLEALQMLCPLKVPHLADVTMGIGGGFSEMGEVCGAVSGVIMAIGLDIIHRYPRETASQRFFIMKATQKFIRDVRQEFGSVCCSDLTGCDMSGCLIPGDEKYAAFRTDQETQIEACFRLVRFAIVYPLSSGQEGEPYSVQRKRKTRLLGIRSLAHH